MAEFKSREEYEKWKTERQQKIQKELKVEGENVEIPQFKNTKRINNLQNRKNSVTANKKLVFVIISLMIIAAVVGFFIGRSLTGKQSAVAHDRIDTTKFDGVYPSDKNYSSERDSKILKIFKEAESKGVEDISILKLNYKKNRGYKVGGDLWNNEQWAYIAEIKNNTAAKLSCSIYLKVYDASGFLLDKYLLFAGYLQPTEIKNKSAYFFIELLYVNQINSADMSSDCMTIR